MKIFNKFIYFIFFSALIHSVWANQNIPDKEMSRPSMAVIKKAVDLVAGEYQKSVLSALRKSGRNARELIYALENVSLRQREGMAFLIANMPGRDLVALKGNFLVENEILAYQAMSEVPWGKDIPPAIFFNDVLPYASFNEYRDNWRADFYKRFIKIAKNSKTIDQAVIALNKYAFDALHVSYDAVKRPKPDQSPNESIRARYASCTGLSILLTDVLRSVGIPARIAAIAMWPDGSGNHTWVEIWDGHWRYIEADQPSPLDHTWFTMKASRTDSGHPIYATSFKRTRLKFPMRWALNLKFVSAIDVTENYRNLK
ncbi:MAG: transglutaminase domain-containing protein [Candidatus Omnitrophica bacterium]|nr:transglutaminase domain-containing protein [Candidatus Omnitrophota bacterium]